MRNLQANYCSFNLGELGYLKIRFFLKNEFRYWAAIVMGQVKKGAKISILAGNEDKHNHSNL